MATNFLMPHHDPPFRPRDVRDLYAKGTWAYCLGKPAWEHPQYKRAVDIAKRGRRGRPSFNPWWIRNCSDVCAVLDGCWMDEKRGERAVVWEEMLHHFEDQWSGKPFILSDWQRYDIELPLFGWQRANGTRRFRRDITFIPKKNGKTTMCAARALFLTGPDGWDGCETYTVSTSQKQSHIMFRAGEEMLRRSPDLLPEFNLVPSRYRIVHPATASFWVCLPEEPDSTEGFKVNAIMKDEIHVWKNRKTYDSFKYSMASRTEPMDSTISTSGEYDPVSIGYEEYQYIKAVLFAENGAEADWSVHGFVAELAESEMELWHEPRIAIKTNPNIDVTIQLTEDQERCIEIKNRPSLLNNFLWKRRNVWVQSLHVWIEKEKWEACKADYTEEDLRGMTCYPGIDASLKDDIFALTLVFPPQEGLEKWRLLFYMWVPEETILLHDEQNHGWYSMWIKQGYVLKTPGGSVRQDYIRNKLLELREVFSIRTIGYDERYCGKLAQELEDDGFDIGSFNQSFSAMNEPVVLMETLVEEGKLEHPGNPAADWQFSNAHIRENQDGLKKIAKASKQTGKAGGVKRFKVDVPVSAVMGVGTSLLEVILPASQMIG